MVRVPLPVLGEKEYLQLIRENPIFLASGNGIHDVNIFRKRKRGGATSQGAGFIGNILKTFGPKILPFLRKFILPAAKRMGSDVVADLASGRTTLKKSLKKCGKQG